MLKTVGEYRRMSLLWMQVVMKREDYEDCNNGLPVTSMEVRVVDDDQTDVPVGQMGEIVVRGPQLFSGYLGKPEVTQRTFGPDGWYKTGDVGYINDKGEVRVDRVAVACLWLSRTHISGILFLKFKA